MLDNNTNSSVKSRFNNKVFNGKVIVITSAVPLRYWYTFKRHEYGGSDGLIQLYRRIGLYVDVQSDFIRIYNHIDNNGNPDGDFKFFENDVPKLVKQQEPGTDFFAVFESMCKVVF